MSRDYRDQRGGHKRKFPRSEEGRAEFTRRTRRAGRTKAKQALRNGCEPDPMYAVEREYYD